MKGGRAIRKTLRSVETVDGLALIDCSVRWRGVDIDLDLTITNTGPMAWARVVTSTCLQRPAARDYLDADDTRTWLCSDEGFVSAAELAFPPRRDSLYAWVGEELPMKSGARRRLAEPPVFAVSLDGRFVLGYAWRQGRRLFLGAGAPRSPTSPGLHSDPEFGTFEPQRQLRRQGILFVHEGTLEDAYRRYDRAAPGLRGVPRLFLRRRPRRLRSSNQVPGGLPLHLGFRHVSAAIIVRLVSFRFCADASVNLARLAFYRLPVHHCADVQQVDLPAAFVGGVDGDVPWQPAASRLRRQAQLPNTSPISNR